MKAIEYVEKYFSKDFKTVDELRTSVYDMFKEFLGEFDAIKKQRNPKTVDAIVGIVRTLNEKWNSVAEATEKKFGDRIVKRNVIWNELLANEFPTYQRKPD